MFLSTAEAAIVFSRTYSIQRGLDVAVRSVMLGNKLTHNEFRELVCRGGLLLDETECMENVRIEMREFSVAAMNETRNWTGNEWIERREKINAKIAAGTYTDDLDADGSLTSAGGNLKTLVRVCYTMSPVYPRVGFGAALSADAEGDFKIIATTSFVKEPD